MNSDLKYKKNPLLLNSIVLAIKVISIMYTIDLLIYSLGREIQFTYRANRTFDNLVFKYGCFSLILLIAIFFFMKNLWIIGKPINSVGLGIIIAASIGVISKFYTEGDILFEKIS